MMSLNSRVKLGVKWLSGLRMAGQIISWSITVLVIRLLQPSDYGIMALSSTFISFFTLLNEFGLNAAIVQANKLTSEILKSALGLIFVINCTLFIIIIGVSPYLALFFDEPLLSPVLRLLACQLIFTSFSVIPDALIMRYMAFKKKAIANFVSGLISSVFTFFLALNGFGVWSLVGGNLILVISNLIILNVLAPFRVFKPNFVFNKIISMMKFGGFITLDRVLWFLYAKADTFIVGKLLGKEILGLYSVTMDLATLPSQKLNSIINQVSFPAFSRLQNQIDKLKNTLRNSLRLISFFAIPVFWMISCLAPEIVLVILGDDWQEIITPLRIISLVMPFRMLSPVLNSTVKAVGKPEINVLNLFIAVIIMPISLMIGSSFGFIGIAFAWLTAYPIIFFIELFLTSTVIDIKIFDFINTFFRAFAIGVLIYMLVSASGLFITNLNLTTRLALLCFVSVVTASSAAYLLERPILKQVISFVSFK